MTVHIGHVIGKDKMYHIGVYMMMLSEVKGSCKNDISLDLFSAFLKQLLKISLANDLGCTAELTEDLLNSPDRSHKRALQTNHCCVHAA